MTEALASSQRPTLGYKGGQPLFVAEVIMSETDIMLTNIV